MKKQLLSILTALALTLNAGTTGVIATELPVVGNNSSVVEITADEQFSASDFTFDPSVADVASLSLQQQLERKQQRAAAAEGEISAFALGDEETPFTISTAAQLAEFAKLINAGNTNFNSAHYQLTNDIDLSAYAVGATVDGVTYTNGWIPIGTAANKFAGTFDGQNHKITNLTIDDTADSSTAGYQGLFGYATGVIQNLGVEDVSVKGTRNVGGVVGQADGSVSNCYATGILMGRGSLGGVVGRAEGSVSNCYSTVRVSDGVDGRSGGNVGGVVGWAAIDSSITNCYSTGSVSGGGLVGGVVGSARGTVSHCYATGSVRGTGSVSDGTGNSVGGVVGSTASPVSSCVALNPFVSGSSKVGAVVGELASDTAATVSDCFYWGSMSVMADGSAVTTPTDGTTKLTYSDGLKSGSDPFAWTGFTDASVWAAGSTKALPTLQNVGGTQYSTLPLWITSAAANNLKYIYTAADLAALAKEVNNGTDSYADKTILLMNDIDLSAYTKGATVGDTTYTDGWTPIGTQTNGFAGTFDGQNHKITNLTIFNRRGSYQGLFGYLKGTIQSLGVVNTNIQGGNNVGGVVGYGADTSVITNCYATGTVNTISESVGGVVGRTNGKVTDCYAHGNMEGMYDLGGVVGAAADGAAIEGCYATGSFAQTGGRYIGAVIGSVTGSKENVTIKNCYTTGELIFKNNASVGGVIGQVLLEETESGITVEISNCYSTSNVNAGSIGGVVGNVSDVETVSTNQIIIQGCYTTGNLVGQSNAGGIVGVASQPGKGTITITDCLTTGNVTAKEVVGGIVGSAQNSTIQACYSTGSITQTTGALSNAVPAGAGGILGYSNGSTVKASYTTGSVRGVESVGGVVGHTSANSTINHCVALSPTVSGNEDVGAVVGAVVGEGKLTQEYCYYRSNMNITVNGAAGTKPTDGAALTWGSGSLDDSGKPYSWAEFAAESWDNTTSTTLPTLKKVGNSITQSSTLPSWEITESDTNPATADTVYIYKAEDLAALATDVNKGNNYKGKTVLLMSNIDLGRYKDGGVFNEITYTNGWIPIGTATNKFAGTFDGQNHKITKLSINNPTVDSQGLFGGVGGGGIIKNLGVENASIIGKKTVGGIVGGISDTASITNCYVTGSIRGEDTVGGVVGGASASNVVTGCYSTGTVSGSATKIGGIVGRSFGTVTQCYSTSSVGGAEGSHVGGVAGDNYGTISNCYSTGNVSGTSTIGGVVGYNEGGILNCYSTGNVSGSSTIGGVVGYTDGGILNCYSTGNVSGTSSFIGGIVGNVAYNGKKIAITNCVALNPTVSGKSGVGAVVGLIDDNAKPHTTVSNCYTFVAMTGDNLGEADSGILTERDGKLMNGIVPFAWADTGFSTANGWDIPSEPIRLPFLTATPSNPSLPLSSIGTHKTVTLVYPAGSGKLEYSTDSTNGTDGTWSVYNADITVIVKAKSPYTVYVRKDAYKVKINDSTTDGKWSGNADDDLMLTPVLTPIDYPITYTLNGGALATGETNPADYNIESAAITLKNPTREGYTFAGWTGTDITEKSMGVTIAAGSTGNREFTATWTTIPYTITYELNGGALAASDTNPTGYNIESAAITLKNPTRTGYAFAGWTLDNSTEANVDVTIATGSIGNRKYTATWAEMTYRIASNETRAVLAVNNHSVTKKTVTLIFAILDENNALQATDVRELTFAVGADNPITWTHNFGRIPAKLKVFILQPEGLAPLLTKLVELT